MGYSNIYHIAPAILHMNPGIDRFEFLSLLRETHPTGDWYTQTEKEILLTKIPEQNYGAGDEYLFRTLEGLAQILLINPSNEWIEFKKIKFDEQGLPLETPYFYREVSGKGTFTLYVNESNIAFGEKIFHIKSFEKIKKGELVRINFKDAPGGIVTQVLSKKIGGKEYKSEFHDKKTVICNYEVKVIPFRRVIKKEVYTSEEELHSSWPIFSAEKKYDWATNKGGFRTDIGNQMYGFYWFMKKDKYYFDNYSFDIMNGSEYRQLIIAEEAIKNKVWKPFSYNGAVWFGKFLEQYPSSKGMFNKACTDSHYSLYAKKKAMTNNEMLRTRMLAFAGLKF
ncbi:MAG: hypothetical protein ACP5N2_04520 [Candidatus Nanoarchaeia archaeon]